MGKKKIGRIKVLMVAVATVVLAFTAAGCGCNDAKKQEVTDANGNVVTNVEKKAPAQTDKNGKIIENNKNQKTGKSDIDVDNADKSNGDDVNDLVNDKGKKNSSSKKDKASKKNSSSNKNNKKSDSKKNDKKDGKKKGNFEVKDQDDETGFGPLIDG